MRRLMKGKRRKSENPSDAESEENGGNAHNSNDAEQTRQGGDDDGESAPKLKRRSVRGRDSNKSGVTDDTAIKNDNDNGSSELINQENGNAGKSSEGIRRKKEERKATTSHDEIESEEEYEVERIVSHRTIKGRRQFLIRWKGYEEDADTWEDESELNCSKLIDDFFTDQETEQENKSEEKHDESQNSKNDDAIKETDDKLKKTPKKRPRITKRTRKSSAKATKKRNNGEKLEHDENENDNEKQNAEVEKKTKKLRGSRQQNDNDKKHEENNEDDEKEFEVEKIIDVYFKKNKDREFLIRWKGFPPSDDTWEPEANLNCPDLITKFMNKVEKAKASELRELRTNPSHTKRYTLTMPGQGRRLSRRNAGKERC